MPRICTNCGFGKACKGFGDVCASCRKPHKLEKKSTAVVAENGSLDSAQRSAASPEKLKKKSTAAVAQNGSPDSAQRSAASPEKLKKKSTAAVAQNGSLDSAQRSAASPEKAKEAKTNPGKQLAKTSKHREKVAAGATNADNLPCRKFALGEQVDVVVNTIMREEESLNSREVMQLATGAMCAVVKHGEETGGEEAGRRLQVLDVLSERKGWISCVGGSPIAREIVKHACKPSQENVKRETRRASKLEDKAALSHHGSSMRPPRPSIRPPPTSADGRLMALEATLTSPMPPPAASESPASHEDASQRKEPQPSSPAAQGQLSAEPVEAAMPDSSAMLGGLLTEWTAQTTPDSQAALGGLLSKWATQIEPGAASEEAKPDSSAMLGGLLTEWTAQTAPDSQAALGGLLANWASQTEPGAASEAPVPPMCKANGKWKEGKAPTSPMGGAKLVVGSTVKVICTFEGNSTGLGARTLRVGETGAVKEVDEVGRALINFGTGYQWVYKKNLSNLQVVPPEAKNFLGSTVKAICAFQGNSSSRWSRVLHAGETGAVEEFEKMIVDQDSPGHCTYEELADVLGEVDEMRKQGNLESACSEDSKGTRGKRTTVVNAVARALQSMGLNAQSVGLRSKLRGGSDKDTE